MGKDPVIYDNCMTRMIATVSPDVTRYHDFSKVATKLYMPCPSEIQLRLMGQIYRTVFMEGDEYHLSDSTIRQRVRMYGPFTRNILCWTNNQFDEFESDRSAEILTMTSNVINNVMTSGTHVVIKQNARQCGLSFCLARIAIQRDISPRYGIKSVVYYVTSERAITLFSQHIASLNIELVMAHLKEFNSGHIKLEDFISVYLERAFWLHSVSDAGLSWRRWQMRHEENLSNPVIWEDVAIL